jgi:hypothetical protein
MTDGCAVLSIAAHRAKQYDKAIAAVEGLLPGWLRDARSTRDAMLAEWGDLPIRIEGDPETTWLSRLALWDSGTVLHGLEAARAHVPQTSAVCAINWTPNQAGPQRLEIWLAPSRLAAWFSPPADMLVAGSVDGDTYALSFRIATA